MAVDKSVGRVTGLWIAAVDGLGILGISLAKAALLTIWGVNRI
jgi:hypothetical protein